jgi:hypothetical protein
MHSSAEVRALSRRTSMRVPGEESTMTAPPLPDLVSLDRDITLALAALRRARQVFGRSTDPDIAGLEREAEWRLNRLLERRLTATRT